ncbi:MAG: acyltransferase, partial [Nitrospirae bacterium]
LKGAQIICHPANLVLPYCPNAMPVRCLENRVFAVTANRIGKEQRQPDKALRYIGLSQVVSPNGDILFRAKEDTEILYTTVVDVKEADNKSINPYNDLFEDRRPEFYYLY